MKKELDRSSLLEMELASPSYNDLDTATIKLPINQKKGLTLAIWTKQIEDSKNFVLVAKLFKGNVIYRAWTTIVRDYIDMTHVRNYIIKDCEFWFDSDAFLMHQRFAARYRYERAPEHIETYIALK